MGKPTELSVQDFRDNLATYVRRAAFGKERFVVTFHGKPACVLGPLELIGMATGMQTAPKLPARTRAKHK